MKKLPVFNHGNLGASNGFVSFCVDGKDGMRVVNYRSCREATLLILYSLDPRYNPNTGACTRLATYQLVDDLKVFVAKHTEMLDTPSLRLLLDHMVGIPTVLYTRQPFQCGYELVKTFSWDFGKDVITGFNYIIPRHIYATHPALTHLLLGLIREAAVAALNHYEDYLCPVTQEEITKILVEADLEQATKVFKVLYPNLKRFSAFDLTKLPVVLKQQDLPSLLGKRTYEWPDNVPFYWSEV